MSFNLRLLIVEDDEAETQSWHRAIEMHNAQPEQFGFAIMATYAKSVAEVTEVLSGADFDAAVVDIRLDQGEGAAPNTDGNLVVATLLETEIAIVAIFTGEAHQVNVPDWATALVRTFRKGGDVEAGEGTDSVMTWLAKNASMVKTIRNAQLKIKKEMARLFTTSIWPRWGQWQSRHEPDDYLELALTRHWTSHLHAVLLDSSAQKAHPEEWYFIPPIRTGLRTGDIVKNTAGEYEIVVTPRCDLAVANKARTVQFARCKIDLPEWKVLNEAVSAQSEALKEAKDEMQLKAVQKKLNTATEQLRKFTQHNGNKTNVHFLPEMSLVNGQSLGPFLVEFDVIKSLDIAGEEIAKVERIASLTSEFLPSLVERLGGYFSRIGTPDYSHVID